MYKDYKCKRCGERSSRKDSWCKQRTHYNRGKHKHTLRDHRLGKSLLPVNNEPAFGNNERWRVDASPPGWRELWMIRRRNRRPYISPYPFYFPPGPQGRFKHRTLEKTHGYRYVQYLEN